MLLPYSLFINIKKASVEIAPKRSVTSKPSATATADSASSGSSSSESSKYFTPNESPPYYTPPSTASLNLAATVSAVSACILAATISDNDDGDEDIKSPSSLPPSSLIESPAALSKGRMKQKASLFAPKHPQLVPPAQTTPTVPLLSRLVGLPPPTPPATVPPPPPPPPPPRSPTTQLGSGGALQRFPSKQQLSNSPSKRPSQLSSFEVETVPQVQNLYISSKINFRFNAPNFLFCHFRAFHFDSKRNYLTQK